MADLQEAFVGLQKGFVVSGGREQQGLCAHLEQQEAEGSHRAPEGRHEIKEGRHPGALLRALKVIMPLRIIMENICVEIEAP